ncbi:MAG: response regulator transcription factor [Actinobacteria bacterium]|nr:response regulator transcription factor [Actinomycetota bacterium]
MSNLDPKPSVLIVDDEIQMLEIISFALETQGFNTSTAMSAMQAMELFEKVNYEILILDVMLPDFSGTWVCNQVRQVSNVPIIMLTAKGEVADRVVGLEAGADDYVVKPFHPRELALRAQAIVKRSRENQRTGVVHLGWLVIDPKNATVMLRGHRVSLSQSEFRLLMVLTLNVGEVMGVEYLLREVWGVESLVGGREMVKTAIYRLRIKLGDSVTAPVFIQTVRGKGYRMTRGDPA